MRGLIVVVLVVGASLGWLLARIQREAVAGIKKADGAAFYDWQWKNSGLTLGKPWPAEWIVDTIGVDYSAMSSLLCSQSHPMMHCFMSEIFGKLRELRMTLTSEVTDRGLAHLQGLTNLLELNLMDARITDAGMAYLKRLTSLLELDLSYTKVTDAGMVNLKEMTALRKLDLSYTHVTDAGLVHLRGMTNLSELSLIPRIVTTTERAGREQTSPISRKQIRTNFNSPTLASFT